LPAEAANILRRGALTRSIPPEAASLAHADLRDLGVQLFPHEPFAERIWALRQNVTCYGARYVAVAESVDAPLATLDARLAKAAGPRCAFILTPTARAIPH
jgi:predicted nucleic acid-binding protein